MVYGEKVKTGSKSSTNGSAERVFDVIFSVVVVLNEHGSVYLDDTSIAQHRPNDVFVCKIVMNRMVDSNNIKTVLRPVLSVDYPIR
jgi:hypothetical protein